jgi:ubiquinone/menaquinone biosynthesis C-methylase UbiE
MTKKNTLTQKEKTLEFEHRLDADRVFTLLPIRPYQKVADIGCGTGHFSLPLAKYLYDGTVYVVDTKPEMLEATREKLMPYRFSNVEFIKSKETSVPISSASLDGALISCVLYQASDRAALLRSVSSLMQHGGWIAIIEWYKRDTPDGPAIANRVSEDEIKTMAVDNKLRFVSVRSLGDSHYIIIFAA